MRSLLTHERIIIYYTRAHLMCTLGYRLSACSRHGQSVEEEYRKNGIEITVYLYCNSLVEISTRTGAVPPVRRSVVSPCLSGVCFSSVSFRL